MTQRYASRTTVNSDRSKAEIESMLRRYGSEPGGPSCCPCCAPGGASPDSRRVPPRAGPYLLFWYDRFADAAGAAGPGGHLPAGAEIGLVTPSPGAGHHPWECSATRSLSICLYAIILPHPGTTCHRGRPVPTSWPGAQRVRHRSRWRLCLPGIGWESSRRYNPHSPHCWKPCQLPQQPCGPSSVIGAMPCRWPPS